MACETEALVNFPLVYHLKDQKDDFFLRLGHDLEEMVMLDIFLFELDRGAKN